MTKENQGGIRMQTKNMLLALVGFSLLLVWLAYNTQYNLIPPMSDFLTVFAVLTVLLLALGMLLKGKANAYARW